MENRVLQKTIRLVCRIEPDETRIAVVSPRIGGRVEALYADFTGRSVRRGEALLSLYSPELVATQEEYLLALRAEQEWGRSPFTELAVAGKELAAAARRRLLLWDIPEAQIRRLEERGTPETALPCTALSTGSSSKSGSFAARTRKRGRSFSGSPTCRSSG